MINEAKILTINKLIRIIVFIFIDTFFSVYFFQIVNYDLLSISKYYLSIYIGLPLGFYIIRKDIKKGYKSEHYRIGTALTGIFLLLILLLKDNIINYIPILGFINGLGQGIYYYPTNIYDTELITNKERDKYTGYLNMINMIINITIPLLLGYILNKISYIIAGKIIIVLIVVMFILGFFIKNKSYNKEELKLKEFIKYFNNRFKKLILIRFLEGLTYSSSALSVIIIFYSILYLQNNLYIGILTSIEAILALITCVIFTKRNKKYDKLIINITNILTIISLLLLTIFTNFNSLSCYMIILNSLLIYVQLISKNNVSNITNNYKEIKTKYKEEYHLVMELILNFGRIIGYLLLIIISLLKNVYYLKIILSFSIVSYFILLFHLKDLNE